MRLSARLLIACLCGVTAAVPASAQEAEGARSSTGTASYGRSLTYPDILAETVRLRRRPAPADSLASTDPFIGIQGLVMDETATPSGRIFYDAFFLLWTPPPGAERTTVTLGEQPLPGNGTAILARADGEVLFQTRLPRRQEEVEDLARAAVQFVRQRLAGG